MKTILFLICILLITNLCAQHIDKDATMETFALFRNLKKLSENHVLFGLQHATEYGHGRSGGADRPDVKSVSGSHPAVIGIDFGGFAITDESARAQFKESLNKNIEDTARLFCFLRNTFIQKSVFPICYRNQIW